MAKFTNRGGVAAADQAGDAVELFLGVEVDDDLAAVGGLDADQDGGAEPLVEVLLELEDVRGLAAGGGEPGLGGVLADAGRAGSARRSRRGPRSGGPRGPRR